MTDAMQLPASRESEEALLGSLLINPGTLNYLKVAPDDFFIVRHQMIYRAMRAIGPSELDLVSLTEVLERKGHLAEVGGQAFLTGLTNKCPNSYNYEIYERAIMDSAMRRQVLISCNKLAVAAYEMDKNIGDAVSRVVSELVQSAKPIGGAVSIKDFLGELYREMETRAADPKEIYGLATGIPDFDRITAGLQPGEEFILAGEPGTGKSLLAVQMACGMAESGYPGVIYSLEMKGIAIVRRRLSAITKISTYNMRSGIGMNDRWEKIVKGIEAMEKLPIFISDASNWTTLQLRADISRLIAQEQIRWFVLDYHDLLKDQVGDNTNDRSMFITQELHAICKDLDLAGLIIQSMNKAGFYSKPTKANLSGSSKVSYTSDNIAFLIPDENENSNVVNLVWDKVREGTGNRAMKLIMNDTYPAFENYTSDARFNDYTK